MRNSTYLKFFTILILIFVFCGTVCAADADISPSLSSGSLGDAVQESDVVAIEADDVLGEDGDETLDPVPYNDSISQNNK